MINRQQFSVRDVIAEDRQKLANLVHFEIYVHRHLDWKTPLDWIGGAPFLLLEQRKEIVAALACPPDPPGMAWIRLFAVSSLISVEKAWKILWPATVERILTYPDLSWAAAIPLQHWFESLLKKSNFIQTQRVVMLNREFNSMPERLNSVNRDVVLRPMTLDDLEVVETIDKAAFLPVWQNSLSGLEVAFRQAAVATIAEYDEQPVGYQISTATPMGGHLARLAVIPEYQGHGIGYELVRDTLMQFEQRGAHTVTVNTQNDNLASLALYKKSGFHLTGEEYPVYRFDPHQ